jgi:hypothetical protein
MLEKVQRMIDQLQDDLDITKTIGSQAGPSGPEFIDLDQIAGLDDPEFTMSLVGSPTGVLAQPEIVESLQRTDASNLLRKILKIYDDDESPEVSLGTPVHIKE